MLEMTVLERQRARQIHCRILSPASTSACRVDDFQDLVTPGEISSTEFRSTITRRSTSPEVVAKKRKGKNVKEVREWKGGNSIEKRMKPNIKEAEDQSKITEQTEMTKQSSIKASPRLDFVHVRARRGQATDSHSLAERARREKISERMKYLQNLVPGCNKIAGKAGMLDEIINYVQSLQQQVEFLSMKLAVLNPRLDEINVDQLFVKQENLQVFPTIEVSPETANSSPYLNQLGICSSSVTVPETPLFNSASIPDFELSSTWGDNLQSLYSMRFEQGGPPLLSPSSFLSEQRSGIEDENETLFDLDHNKVVPF